MEYWDTLILKKIFIYGVYLKSKCNEGVYPAFYLATLTLLECSPFYQPGHRRGKASTLEKNRIHRLGKIHSFMEEFKDLPPIADY